MDSFFECCSYIKDYLPKPGLHYIPATILGLICSVIFLTLMHKKKSGKTFFTSFQDLLMHMFVLTPCFDHDESMNCDSGHCVRCNRKKETATSVIKKWKALEFDSMVPFTRIEEAVTKLALSGDATTFKSNSNQRPTLFSMNVSANPWWTEFSVFGPDRELLKVNNNIILEEFESLSASLDIGDTVGWKRNNIPDGHWCIYPLIDQGIINEKNCYRCPNTSALLSNLPSIMKGCIFGNAFFSLVYPDSHIEPHCGPTNIRIRCHFGLRASDNCLLEVDGQQYRWKEGDSILFDDSFEHSVIYPPQKTFTKPRAVLLIDFWHPDISEKEKKILLKLLPPDAS